MGVIWCGLYSALRIAQREGMIAALQRQFRSAPETRVLNVRSKAQGFARSLRVAGLGLRLRGSARSYIVGLRMDGTAERGDEQEPIGSLQESMCGNQ